MVEREGLFLEGLFWFGFHQQGAAFAPICLLAKGQSVGIIFVFHKLPAEKQKERPVFFPYRQSERLG